MLALPALKPTPLTAWNIPDNKYVDTVVALAQKGILFLWDLGYFKVQALAHIAEARAYFLSRLGYPRKAGHHMASAI